MEHTNTYTLDRAVGSRFFTYEKLIILLIVLSFSGCLQAVAAHEANKDHYIVIVKNEAVHK